MSQTEPAQDPARAPSSRATSIIVGGIVSLFFGLLPFLGPMIGGASAGYLRGQDKSESVIMAVLGSALASVVYIGFVVLVGIAQIVEGAPENVFVLAIMSVFPLAYFYGFAALGGFIGAAFSSRGSP